MLWDRWGRQRRISMTPKQMIREVVGMIGGPEMVAILAITIGLAIFH
jgi:hypothetical protein